VDIGRYVTIKRAVIDKGANIPDGMEIGMKIEEDRKRFFVTEKGITLVTPDMLGQRLHYAR
jgi:glucose-1-phosphate adenylyltransferase